MAPPCLVPFPPSFTPPCLNPPSVFKKSLYSSKVNVNELLKTGRQQEEGQPPLIAHSRSLGPVSEHSMTQCVPKMYRVCLSYFPYLY